MTCLNLETAKLNNLNFPPLEVVSRYRDTQHRLDENFSSLFAWSTQSLEVPGSSPAAADIFHRCTHMQ